MICNLLIRGLFLLVVLACLHLVAHPVGRATFRGIDHVGYTVPDLQQAIDFFTQVFGCELIYKAGPFKDDTGAFMTTHMNVNPRAILHLAMLRCGSVNNIELLEHEAPDQTHSMPPMSELEAPHLGRNLYQKSLEVLCYETCCVSMTLIPAIDTQRSHLQQLSYGLCHEYRHQGS